MGSVELLFLAVGLSMDAFAVSVCKGLAQKKVTGKAMVVCGAWFGIFQAVMPTIGYLMGAQFSKHMTAVTPWIAFVLLVLIGGNMIREALSSEKEEASEALDVKTMFIMAVATSIDALAIGVTFACVPVNILPGIGELANTLIAVCIIGTVTFFISAAGVKIGGVFGSRYEKKAELVGGIILICLGIKILVEHLFF